MRMDDAVGINLRAIRNRDQTGIRWVVVAACPYPPSEASCEAGAMRGEVTPYRREHGKGAGHAAEENRERDSQGFGEYDEEDAVGWLSRFFQLLCHVHGI